MKILLTIIWIIAYATIGALIECNLNVEIKAVYALYGCIMGAILTLIII